MKNIIKTLLLAISFIAIATYSSAADTNNSSDDILAGITPMTNAEMQDATGEDIYIYIIFPSHPEDNISIHRVDSYMYVYQEINGETGEILVSISYPI